MKKPTTLLLLGLCLGFVSFAQDQLENAGFEEWENILATPTDTIREPLEWSSLKTSDNGTLAALAPVVCARSNEAHSGNYSLKLTNVASFLVANGIATNGRVHPDINTALAYTFTDTVNEEWHTKLTSRPDSITGWYQYTPQGGDSLQVKVTLHQGFGKQPDQDFENTWIGAAEFKSGTNTAGAWTRFSAPFIYYSGEAPAYALVVISSGNAYAAVAGSTALFDDLELVYSASSVTNQLPEQEGFVAVTGPRTLWIRNMDPSDFQQIRIYSMTGQVVWSGRIDSERIELTGTDTGRGIYVIRLTGPQRIHTQKVLLR